MQAREYAQALYEIENAEKSPASTVKNLVGVLEKRGHTRLLPRILAEYERLVNGEGEKDAVTVRVADEKARRGAITEAHTLSESMGFDKKKIHIEEDESLIDGYAIEGPGFRYDTSAKAGLLALYKQLTNR